MNDERICKMFRHGMNGKEIAVELRMSPTTVFDALNRHIPKEERKEIRKKFQVTAR